MSATPRPWHIDEENWQSGYALLAKQGPVDVCPAIAHGLSDARLIVRAVNCHDELVAVGEELLHYARNCAAERGMLERASDVLARAKGDPA